MPIAFEYKKFSHIEVKRESSPMDSEEYVRQVCASGWMPLSISEGSCELQRDSGTDKVLVEHRYVLVHAIRSYKVDTLAPEPPSIG